MITKEHEHGKEKQIILKYCNVMVSILGSTNSTVMARYSLESPILRSRIETNILLFLTQLYGT